jgi:type II secretory pathway component PulM
MSVPKSIVLLWGRCAPRERTAVTIAGFVACAAAAYGVSVYPGGAARSHLEEQLPQLRQDLASLRVSAAEVRRLRDQVARSAVSRAGALATVEASLRVAGLQATASESGPEGARGVAVHVAAADPAALFDWLQVLHREQGLHVESARVEGLPGGGVRGELILAGGP